MLEGLPWVQFHATSDNNYLDRGLLLIARRVRCCTSAEEYSSLIKRLALLAKCNPEGLKKLKNHIEAFFLISEHKICIVGLDNAGKTTILYQFLMNEVKSFSLMSKTPSQKVALVH